MLEYYIKKRGYQLVSNFARSFRLQIGLKAVAAFIGCIEINRLGSLEQI